MKYFEFYNPVKICAGDDALKHLNFELYNLGVKKPLLLSDNGLNDLGIVKKITTIAGIENYELYTNIPTDSSDIAISDIISFIKDNSCDGIIALGGGSVIDTAKGVKMAYGRADNLKSVMGMNILQNGDNLPFIVLPTTAGTGSEVTNVAVIKDEKTNVKMEYISPYLMPNVAIIDSRLTDSLPAKVTASTAIDALSHAIEGFSCLQKNPISDAYAITSIKLIFDNVLKVIDNPKDKELRLNMALASTLAGLCFGNSMVGGVHAIGHALGSVCHIAHGDAMAILLPNVMEFNKDKMCDIYAALFDTICYKYDKKDLTNMQKCDIVIKVIREFLLLLKQKTGMPTCLNDTNKYDQLKARDVANAALCDGAIILNPKQIDVGDVLEILKNSEK